MYVYVHAHVWSKGQSQALVPGTLPNSIGWEITNWTTLLSIKPKGSSCLCLHNMGLQATTSGMFVWHLRTKLRSSSQQGKHFAIWASSHHNIKNSKSIFHVPFLLSNPHYILTAINRTSTLFPDANWPVQGHSMQISESGFGAFFCLASNGGGFSFIPGWLDLDKEVLFGKGVQEHWILLWKSENSRDKKRFRPWKLLSPLLSLPVRTWSLLNPALLHRWLWGVL